MAEDDSLIYEIYLAELFNSIFKMTIVITYKKYSKIYSVPNNLISNR